MSICGKCPIRFRVNFRNHVDGFIKIILNKGLSSKRVNLNNKGKDILLHIFPKAGNLVVKTIWHFPNKAKRAF